MWLIPLSFMEYRLFKSLVKSWFIGVAGWLVQLSFLMRKATLEGFLIFLFFMYYKWLKHKIEGEMARSVKARSFDKSNFYFYAKGVGT